MYNLTKMLCMHRGCQSFYNTAEVEKDDHLKQRLKTFNMIIKTIRLMFEKTKKEVHDHINIGKTKGRDDEDSQQEDKQNNNSFMGRQNSKTPGKNSGFYDAFGDDIFTTYHRFFIQPKHAILDKWKKEISEYKRIKLEKRKQRGNS